MQTLHVVNYLSPMVKDNKDSLARQTRVQVKEKVTNANGNLKKYEVMNGTIFIEVDTSDAADAVKTMFAAIKEVVVSELAPLQAIFMKSQLRAKSAEVKA